MPRDRIAPNELLSADDIDRNRIVFDLRDSPAAAYSEYLAVAEAIKAADSDTVPF